MGCDMHCCVEVKDNGVWHKHGPLIKNPRYRPDEPLDRWNQPEIVDRGYDNRSYTTFAILAGVRNRNNLTPISPPKGLPADHDPEVGEHSFSWLSLKEILEFDWDGRVAEQSGYVDEGTYKDWDKKGYPESFCQGVGGGNVETVTEAEYLSNPKDPTKDYYIHATWVQTYRDAVDPEWWETVERLKQYAEQFGGLENVRLVFGFDS